MKLHPIETAPTDAPRGFLAFIIEEDEDGPYIDGVEWLQGPIGDDGCRWCLNSHNRNSFKATHWAPLPEPE